MSAHTPYGTGDQRTHFSKFIIAEYNRTRQRLYLWCTVLIRPGGAGRLYDGCGLAPQNAVSARFLTDLLGYMYNKSDHSAVFFNSLPKAGQEGTLRYFLRNTKLVNKVVAKSGSIGGVQCYAGYLIDGKKKYAFTVMVNKFDGDDRPEVRKGIEQFLLSIDEITFPR